MSHEITIHQAQTIILRELLFMPQASFTELQKASHLEADHFKFHLSKLVELGYVEKVTYGKYALTRKGKEHANKLDTDTNTIERQPKVSVALIVGRKSKTGQKEYLCQQRLKNPYFGFWGRFGGKVRWGESFEEAAARELEEETGLTGEFAMRLVYRKRDFDKKTKELLEDKIFLIMEATKYSGDLVEHFEGGYNKWMTQTEFGTTEKHFESALEFPALIEQGQSYICRDFFYDSSEY
jgi:hypothetical protein